MDMVKVAFDHDELELLASTFGDSVEATRRVGYSVPLSALTVLQKLRAGHALICPHTHSMGSADQAAAYVRDNMPALIEKVTL